MRLFYMHRLNKKGFTLLEAVIALLLLGLFMLGIAMVTSSLTSVTIATESITNPNTNVVSLLEYLQQDSQIAVMASSDTDSLQLTDSKGKTVYYCISDGKLYRQAAYLADVLRGSFTAEKSLFKVVLLLKSHRVIETTLYLKGST